MRKVIIFIIIELVMMAILWGVSLDQFCGCDCSAPYWGVKSYITGQSYPSFETSNNINNPSNSPVLPPSAAICFCACQVKIRFPIEGILIFVILSFIVARYTLKKS